MRNTIKQLLVFLAATMLVSCYKDNSVVDTQAISEIDIQLNGIQGSEVNIDKNETFTIQPLITQTEPGKPLSYEWEINYERVSTEKDLSYVGSSLGTFPVRLKVTNEDGSTYKSFTINVNSPYEEGLIVLNEDPNAMGTLSFLRKFPDKKIYEATAADFTTQVFTVNNPGMTIGHGPTDIIKKGNQLYISARDDGKITIINNKTFEVEAVITAPEFPDFKPYRLNVPDDAGTSAMVLTENGRVYTIATRDLLILQNTNLPNDVRLLPKTQFVGGMNFTMNYFWDPAASQLWNLWYLQTNSKDLFAGEDLVHFFAANGFCYVLTQDRANPSTITKTILGEFIQEYFADPLDLREQTTFTNDNLTLKQNSVTLLDQRFFRLIYANGKNIYAWNYSGVDIPNTPYITLDIPGEVTSLETNPEGTELYVGIYDATASGPKGSVIVYDIDRGTKLATFPGVADKPVKLFFKVRT